ncbi:hypothetical protein N9W21_01050 [Shewanella sp.]|nr:hypothetical protein [Shewanella sp.]
MSLKAVPLALALLSFNAAAGDAEKAFSQELTACAAYYQIASAAIASMNAPQMKAVSERLVLSGQKAIEIAEKYQSKAAVQQAVSLALKQHKALAPNPKSLAPLMQKYREPCKLAVTDPSKRLDYWSMASM